MSSQSQEMNACHEGTGGEPRRHLGHLGHLRALVSVPCSHSFRRVGGERGWAGWRTRNRLLCSGRWTGDTAGVRTSTSTTSQPASQPANHAGQVRDPLIYADVFCLSSRYVLLLVQWSGAGPVPPSTGGAGFPQRVQADSVHLTLPSPTAAPQFAPPLYPSSHQTPLYPDSPVLPLPPIQVPPSTTKLPVSSQPWQGRLRQITRPTFPSVRTR